MPQIDICTVDCCSKTVAYETPGRRGTHCGSKRHIQFSNNKKIRIPPQANFCSCIAAVLIQSATCMIREARPQSPRLRHPSHSYLVRQVLFQLHRSIAVQPEDRMCAAHCGTAHEENVDYICRRLQNEALAAAQNDGSASEVMSVKRASCWRADSSLRFRSEVWTAYLCRTNFIPHSFVLPAGGSLRKCFERRSDFPRPAGQGAPEFEWSHRVHPMPCCVGRFTEFPLYGVSSRNRRTGAAEARVACYVCAARCVQFGLRKVSFRSQRRKLFDRAMGPVAKGPRSRQDRFCTAGQACGT